MEPGTSVATPSQNMEQPLVALASGNVRRLQVVELRRSIHRGEIDVKGVLLDPPACVMGMTVIGVMSMTRKRPHASSVWLTKTGRVAARDGINLLQPVRNASQVTRRWAARHCTPVRADVMRNAQNRVES